MSKIRIKNFGPIKEGFKDEFGNEFMDIKKVTVFIGNQGSGKSTVAKLISSFMWMEKALNRGDFDITNEKDLFRCLQWQRLGEYFKSNTHIEYTGEKYFIEYNYNIGVRFWKVIDQNYIVPKIMYVPSERNFLSTIQEAFGFSGLPGPLDIFARELIRSQNQLNGLALELPINNTKYEYIDRRSFISGSDYSKLSLLTASSGFQSFVPLFLVSRYLAMKIDLEKAPEVAEISPENSVRREQEIASVNTNQKLTKQEKDSLTTAIYSKYHNRCFVNIVEEPEQNLFPSSQKAMLYSLFELNNLLPDNKLIITTHSPYLINYLTLAVKAYEINSELKSDSLREKLDAIVPSVSTVNPDNLIIYELNEKDGSVIRLPDYYGIPSDKNYLNQSLGDSNLLYDTLLEIQEDNES